MAVTPDPASFHLTLRLPEPLREDGRATIDIRTPVATLGELMQLLERTVPEYRREESEIYNFAINGEMILHDEESAPLASGDEVELLVALSGG